MQSEAGRRPLRHLRRQPSEPALGTDTGPQQNGNNGWLTFRELLGGAPCQTSTVRSPRLSGWPLRRPLPYQRIASQGRARRSTDAGGPPPGHSRSLDRCSPACAVRRGRVVDPRSRRTGPHAGGGDRRDLRPLGLGSSDTPPRDRHRRRDRQGSDPACQRRPPLARAARELSRPASSPPARSSPLRLADRAPAGAGASGAGEEALPDEHAGWPPARSLRPAMGSATGCAGAERGERRPWRPPRQDWASGTLQRIRPWMLSALLEGHAGRRS